MSDIFYRYSESEYKTIKSEIRSNIKQLYFDLLNIKGVNYYYFLGRRTHALFYSVLGEELLDNDKIITHNTLLNINNIKDKNIVIITDSINTGREIKYVINEINKYNPNKIYTASYIVNTINNPVDIYIISL